MIRNIGLFKRVVEGFNKASNSRNVYTNSIYPYPYRYFNETVYPGVYRYRETYPFTIVEHRQRLMARWLFRIFWTYWWYKALNNPEVFTGHFCPPDPASWTDQELGIPPLEAGSYEDWKRSQEEKCD